MNRYAILASTALVTLLSAPAARAQATAEGAEAIRTVVAAMIGGFGQGVQVKGDIGVTPSGAGYEISIPEIEFGNYVYGPLWSVVLAPTTGTISPGPDDVYTVALTLPPSVTSRAMDRAPIVVTAAGSLGVTVSAATGLPSALTLAIDDLAVAGTERDAFSLGAFAVKARMVPSALGPDLSDVLVGVGARDVASTSGDHGMGLGGGTLEFAATGLDIPAILVAVRTTQALYQRAEHMEASEVQALLNDVTQAFNQLPKMIDGVRLGYSLQGLLVETEKGPVSLDETGFSVALSGLAGETTSIAVTAGLSVLDAPVERPVFRPYLPQYAALDMTLTGIPNGLLAATVSGAVDAAAATGADRQDALGATLLQSLATVLLTSDLVLDVPTLEVSSPAAAVSAVGSAAPDPASPLMTSADATIVIRGLEAAIATASGLEDGRKAAQALTFVQALGKAEVDGEGDPVRRYEIALGSDGKVMVNGTDIAPLIAGH